MRHSWIVLTLLMAGCSTHPIADLMDYTHPGRMYTNEVPPYGGVCGPQGSVLAPGITCPPPLVPSAPPGPAGPPVVPPPVPLPGNVPAPPPAFPTNPAP